MADFHREWLRRPGLRALIRAARDLPARAVEWRALPGGRLPAELAPLLALMGEPDA